MLWPKSFIMVLYEKTFYSCSDQKFYNGSLWENFLFVLDRKFRLFCHRQPFYKYLRTGQNVCSSCRMSKWTLLFNFSWSTLRYMYLCFLCNNKQEYSPVTYVLPASVATTRCLFQRGFHQKAITEEASTRRSLFSEGHHPPCGQPP